MTYNYRIIHVDLINDLLEVTKYEEEGWELHWITDSKRGYNYHMRKPIVPNKPEVPEPGK